MYTHLVCFLYWCRCISFQICSHRGQNPHAGLSCLSLKLYLYPGLINEIISQPFLDHEEILKHIVENNIVHSSRSVFFLNSSKTGRGEINWELIISKGKHDLKAHSPQCLHFFVFSLDNGNLIAYMHSSYFLCVLLYLHILIQMLAVK